MDHYRYKYIHLIVRKQISNHIVSSASVTFQPSFDYKCTILQDLCVRPKAKIESGLILFIGRVNIQGNTSVEHNLISLNSYQQY